MTPDEEATVAGIKATVVRLEKELVEAKAAAKAEPPPRVQAGATARQVEALAEELAQVKQELKAAKAAPTTATASAAAAASRSVLKERK